MKTAALAFFLAAASAAAESAWEAELPPGRETDPIALNNAAGETNPARLEQVQGAAGRLDRVNISELTPKAAIDGIFRVFFKRDGVALPPDMDGAGPFHVFKSNGKWHLLTRKNLAQIFAPLASKDEALAYAQVFNRVLASPYFAQAVTKANADSLPFKSPAISEATEADAAFDVRLVLFSRYRVIAFTEQQLRIQRDGTIEEKGKPRVLKELGPGIMF